MQRRSWPDTKLTWTESPGLEWRSWMTTPNWSLPLNQRSVTNNLTNNYARAPPPPPPPHRQVDYDFLIVLVRACAHGQEVMTFFFCYSFCQIVHLRSKVFFVFCFLLVSSKCCPLPRPAKILDLPLILAQSGRLCMCTHVTHLHNSIVTFPRQFSYSFVHAMVRLGWIYWMI